MSLMWPARVRRRWRRSRRIPGLGHDAETVDCQRGGSGSPSVPLFPPEEAAWIAEWAAFLFQISLFRPECRMVGISHWCISPQLGKNWAISLVKRRTTPNDIP
jgi:hypothetical protein